MKLQVLFFFAILSFIASYSNVNGSVRNEKKDTCFYFLKVPRDIDMPETPYFDTTIVRSAECKVHILVLQSWGTQTSYILSSTKEEMITNFRAGETGRMDITNLPEGKYGMSLMACGNGGGFTLRIK